LHPDLQIILDLWSLDDRVDRSRQQAAALKGAVSRIDEQLRSTADEIHGVSIELEQLGHDEAERNRSLSRYIERRDRAARLLEGGQALDFVSVQKQVDQCGEHVDRLESEILDLMEQREMLVEKGAELEGRSESLMDEKGRAHQKWVVDGRIIRAEIDAVWPERQALHHKLNRELATKYDGFRTRSLVPVAVIGEEACTQCHVVVQGQMRIEVNSGRRLHTCRGCGRWLVPAADEEQ